MTLQEYLQQRPDLVNNWNSGDSGIRGYGTLDRYALANYQNNGGQITEGGPQFDGGVAPSPIPPAAQPPASAGGMTYDRMLAAYRATGRNVGTPQQNDEFNNWVNQVAGAAGVGRLEDIPIDIFSRIDPANPAPQAASPNDLTPDQVAQLGAAADAGDAAARARLTAAGYENIPDTQPLPIEQGILQQALPGLLADQGRDVGRQALVDTLTRQSTADYNQAHQALSPEANAARLAAELAQADTTSGAISASAAQAAQQQLAALQQSIGSMQQNLSGDLAAKAAALQQQIASLTQNIGTYDATQKAALAEQIASTQKNLEDSITAQRNSLATQMASLRGAVDANSVARKAALQTEIDGLTKAQAPMAQARLDSANALSTAVNLGLQSTNDQLTATRAKQGYLGSSSFDQGNLARAAIGARQQGAQVMGTAREANAGDIRAIDTRNATEGRNIANDYANQIMGLTGQEATGTKSLADLLAQGTQGIRDTGAAGTASIKANTGANLLNVGNAGATQQYQDQTMGSTQLRALLDSLAQGTAGIAGNQATQQQAARDSGTVAKQGYFDNSYTRGLGGTLALPTLANNFASTLTNLGNYGNSGLNRTLSALNWWSTPTGTAPTPQYNAAPADTSGNAIGSLGAGLLGAAANVGAANNWWQTPKKSTTGTGDMSAALGLGWNEPTYSSSYQ